MPTVTDDNVTMSRASARHVRVTPQKARRVVDLIRGKAAADAVAVLRFAPQSASDPVRKVLESAIANARVTADDDLDSLYQFACAKIGFLERELERTLSLTVPAPP